MDPPSPQNVRVQYADGTEVTLDMLYVGHDGELHLWHATTRLREPPRRILVDELPPGVSISIDAEFDDPTVLPSAAALSWTVEGETIKGGRRKKAD